jgi:hypothetical protein
MKNAPFVLCGVLLALRPTQAQSPIGVDDYFETYANNLVSVAPPGVLLNDLGSQQKIAVALSSPQHGMATVYENGAFFYMPNSSFQGEDSITYQVKDGDLVSAPATIRIKVKGFPQTISFSPIPHHVLGDTPFALSASAPGGSITLSSSDPSVASVAGGIATIHAVGSTLITARQGGGGIFAAADPVTRELVVTVDPQAFRPTFFFRFGENDSAAENGSQIMVTSDALSTGTLQLAGRATFSTDVSPVASEHLGSHVSARFETVGTHAQRNVISAVDGVGVELFVKASKTSTRACVFYNGVPDANGWGLYQVGNSYQAQLGSAIIDCPVDVLASEWHHLALVLTAGVATFYVDGIIIGTSSSNVPLPTGKLGIGASPVDPQSNQFLGWIDELRMFTLTSYGQFATEEMLLSATNQMITFGPIPTKILGDSAFSLTASSTSGLPVSFSNSNTNVVRISGGSVSIIGAGTTVITARQRGNGQFVSADPISRELTVVAPPNLVLSVGPGPIQIIFTNQPGAHFRIYSTTDIGLPLLNWESLGPALDQSNGTFIFFEPFDSTQTQKFFRVLSE